MDRKSNIKGLWWASAAGLVIGIITIAVSSLAVQYEALRILALPIITINSGATIVGYLLGLPLGSAISIYLPPLLYWTLVGSLGGWFQRIWVKAIVVLGVIIVSIILFVFASFNFHPS
jgi:hypothetical protein